MSDDPLNRMVNATDHGRFDDEYLNAYSRLDREEINYVVHIEGKRRGYTL